MRASGEGQDGFFSLCREKKKKLKTQRSLKYANLLMQSHLEGTLAVALLHRVGKIHCEHPVNPALHDGRNTEPVHGKL